MANILFVHNNFPAQFVGVAAALRAAGHRCAAVGSRTSRALPGIPVARWAQTRGTTPDIWPDAVRAEADLIRAGAAAAAALRLRRSGFEPDLVIGHPGWGETLFLRELFPRARQILLAEFYYRTEGGDVGFDPEFGPLSLADRFRIHAKNATMALAYAEADHLVCPTPFQASMLPDVFRARVRIIHEGVDTQAIRPIEGARLTLPDGCILDGSNEVVSFVNRSFEPLRGFHVFMRALPAFLAARPNAHVVLIGSDEKKGYGAAPPPGTTWKNRMMSEVGPRLDLSRMHFLGPVPASVLHATFSISSAHVYYTYPFVLSWSLLEAMACEALVIASDTAPVRDVVVPGQNGLLRDFFDVDALSDTLTGACREPQAFRPLRRGGSTLRRGGLRPQPQLPAAMALVGRRDADGLMGQSPHVASERAKMLRGDVCVPLQLAR